ncbi:MAG: glycogen debranching enzyme N-terminal domain-containing protein, partial [Kiritimatiellae bacterium]|nr:glycogen debranching enzyme N-terminal domain-containing protein [Kiritimatiellia bacterium]
FTFDYPLWEVGRFEAKCFTVESDGETLEWPEGDNVVIKVEPAESHANNTMYCAFVRQFGEARRSMPEGISEERIADLESHGFAVLPPSGKFRDLIDSLDVIMDEMGFRIIQLLPIHPTPTTYARMGRYGSPYASQDYEEVDPALAVFDRKSTPLEQFCELVDAVHRRSGRVFLDIPINHTGWASRLQIHHPNWFQREKDRTFHSPGAWGVTWEDLSSLDYDERDLWRYMADMFLYWCRQGVDGFRCDAGYKVPVPVWQYIVAKIRQQYPDTVFFLEGLGGPLQTVSALLDKANMNWAYSELFQTYDRDQVNSFLPQSLEVSRTRGVNVHFAETHDNLRLADTSHVHSRMRCALSALCSHAGGFGITNGVEWYATERVNVHGASSLNWGAEANQVAFLGRLNQLLRTDPCFDAETDCRLVGEGHDNVLVLARSHAPSQSNLLVVVNLSSEHSATACWPIGAAGLSGDRAKDLMGDHEIVLEHHGDNTCLPLTPGQVACLRSSEANAKPWRTQDGQHVRAVLNAVKQCFAHERGVCAGPSENEIHHFLNNPTSAIPTVEGSRYRPVVCWLWPQDANRIVMWPDGHAILIQAPFHFSCDLELDGRTKTRVRSVPVASGMHVGILLPSMYVTNREIQMHMRVYTEGATQEATALLRCLPHPTSGGAQRQLSGDALHPDSHYAISCNSRNAFAQVRARWAHLESQYDALLSANLHNAFPVDRQVMFTRCRIWVVYRGYSRSLREARHLHFGHNRNGDIEWRLEVAVGGGRCVCLRITHALDPERNAIRINVSREPYAYSGMLDDLSSVQLILRPDIEDRSHHDKTKAFQGPESHWTHSVTLMPSGFTFSPSGHHRLRLQCDHATFVNQPEWDYMVDHPLERERGLDGASDLFSPGYFEANLLGGRDLNLEAEAFSDGHHPAPDDRSPQAVSIPPHQPERVPTKEALLSAMRHYMVQSDGLKTVIAGFPWFLDWGRDTLICLRGLIAAGWQDDAATILKRFAMYEEQGTLPHIMQGETIGNRDTSDAPLWFIVVCGELAQTEGRQAILDMDCGNRSLRDVLVSIGHNYVTGTSNGIFMDSESGLIFSPSHFTWMDTNYPAGTPREGYPIEIQALWYASLRVLAEADPDGHWDTLLEQ